MKLATPMMIAWLFANAPIPISFGRLMMALTIVVIPAGLVMVQPDLGTAVMLVISAICAVVLAGIRWRHLIILTAAVAAALPFLWSQLRDYQKDRILAMLDPWSDPLGMGYHTIQAQIAIGSAGVGGKGWFSGSQAHLDFVPERSTDFIFAVFAEEFGFVGIIVLMGAYLLVTGRCIRIAYRAQDHYCRILAGALALTFFFYVFVNVGMVSGILPVVGVPLPLISYGGTSMITLMAAFGIIMGMHRRRRLMT
jgi:rod shape determining protein RodA